MNFLHPRFPLLFSIALAFAIPISACGAQVGPDHQGEPLVTIHGEVMSQGQSVAQPAEAALLWLSFDPSATPLGSLRLVGTSVPVTGGFPLGFELHVYAPPPASALLPLAEPVPGGFPLDPSRPAEMGVAAVVALAANADHANVGPPDVLGTSLDMIVVYNSHAIAPQSPSAKLLAGFHAPLTAGYHLVSVARETPEQRVAFVRCTTGGVCLKGHFDDGTSPSHIATADADYAECIAATPDATTCNLWATAMATPAQEKETSDCLGLRISKAGTSCSSGRTFSEAIGSGNATVMLGAMPWQVWH